MAALSFEEIQDDIQETFTRGKFNKTTMLLIGVVLIAVFVLIRKRSPQVDTTEYQTIPDVEIGGYPTMSQADIQGEFADYSSVLIGQIQSDQESFFNDFTDYVDQSFQESKKYTDEVKKGIEQQLGTSPEQLEKKNSVGWTIGHGTTASSQGSGVDFNVDRTALKEEIERTQSVIKYRESKGLDTTKQTSWFNKLKGM